MVTVNKELLTYSFIVIHVNQNLAANKRQKSMQLQNRMLIDDFWILKLLCVDLQGISFSWPIFVLHTVMLKKSFAII